MKAIMVMYDSLNRRMLPPYGCDWVHAPNFQRLAERTVTFENAYVGSMPCMPARRELHTGRYNFLHRSWGPLEPFDDSMPEILHGNGVHSHLTTDHQHYFEDGGCTYHNRYSNWEFSRGQEGDFWKSILGEIEVPDCAVPRGGDKWRQDWINRSIIDCEEKQPQTQTFANGMEFIRTNHQADNWFLQIETFDPHEPFFTHQKYKDLYPHEYDGGHFDWPPYRQVQEPRDVVEHCRFEYAALVSMCDHSLGKILDLMDELDLWDDTLLIVNTDHGFLLGEHDWWAKMVQPFYNEVAHTPLFIWDPRCRRAGERCDSLVQTIDLPATILEYFEIDRPADMQGIPLREVVASNARIREAGLMGIHGAHVSVMDGRYVYMRAPVNEDNSPLHNYTLMTTHMRQRFGTGELENAALAEPFSFTKNCPTVRIPGTSRRWAHEFGTLLFDLKKDPHQDHPIQDAEVEARMTQHLVRLMKETDAPAEQFERLGLEA